MTTFRTGDAVVIGYGERTVPGIVKLASPNGQSLMLQYEAILGGFVGAMPVLGDDRGGYRDLIFGQPVTVERQP